MREWAGASGWSNRHAPRSSGRLSARRDGKPSAARAFAETRDDRRALARASVAALPRRKRRRAPGFVTAFFAARLLRDVDKLMILPLSRRPLALGVGGA
jgi:hypothetical protein